MRKSIFTLVAASASIAAVPASAQIWQIQPRVQTQIRSDINQLQNQIKIAAQRRTISQREAVSLRRQAVDIRQLLAQYTATVLTARK